MTLQSEIMDALSTKFFKSSCKILEVHVGVNMIRSGLSSLSFRRILSTTLFRDPRAST
uniref:ORF57a n=1 Tax=Pinus koraiensis TaxID=88728 RepID=A4QMJ2_PINKO|nr:ORF57a [Pinus koraiensis]